MYSTVVSASMYSMCKKYGVYVCTIVLSTWYLVPITTYTGYVVLRGQMLSFFVKRSFMKKGCRTNNVCGFERQSRLYQQVVNAPFVAMQRQVPPYGFPGRVPSKSA